MSKKISEIEGIGSVYSEKLESVNITTVESLLEKGSTKPGRKAIAELSGIDEGKILDWVNMADLFRIKGVAGQFAELLKAAGVDTVKELRHRNAVNLHAMLVEVQAKKQITRVVPGIRQIDDYIEQAKNLDPMVTY